MRLTAGFKSMLLNLNKSCIMLGRCIIEVFYLFSASSKLLPFSGEYERDEISFSSLRKLLFKLQWG